MGSPEAVHLLFDPITSRIGVKGTAAAARDAFPVATQGRHGGRLIRAYRLMQEFGIALPQTIRFRDITLDKDGILILDLRTATIVQKKARSPNPQPDIRV